jgi:hypothetical protein
MSNHSCSTCGSLLYRTSSGYPGKLAVKIGNIDEEDAVLNYVPDVEIFTRTRPAWVKPVEGAVQEWADFGSGSEEEVKQKEFEHWGFEQRLSHNI